MGFLRTFLALSVLLRHSGSGVFGYIGTGGGVSVECFFIISGFLMALVLNEKYVGASKLKAFYLNRLLRIFPLYWIVLLAVVPITLARPHVGVLAAWHQLHPGTGAAIYIAIVNLLLVGGDYTNFLAVHAGHLVQQSFTDSPKETTGHLLLIRQSWTLGSELVFYSVAPFIVRQRVWIITALFLASLGLRFAGARHGMVDDPWSYRFFPFEFSMFLAGALSYHISRWSARLPAPGDIALMSAALAAAVLYPAYADGNFEGAFFAAPKLTLYAILFLALPSMLRLTRYNALDRFLGDLSFPIYLLHLVVLALVGSLPVIRNHPSAVVFATIGVTLVCAAGIAKYVERPLNRFRHEVGKPRISGRSIHNVTIGNTDL